MATGHRQSKRKADALNVPQVGEDAAERKRVLNVLAQRRYRQRRKEHVEKLEAQVESIVTSTDEICGGDDDDNLDFASFLPMEIQPDTLPPGENPIFVVDDGGQEARGAKGNETTRDIFATFDERHHQLFVTDHQHFFAPQSSSPSPTPLILPSLDSPSTITSSENTSTNTHHPSSVTVENPAPLHWSSFKSFNPLPVDFDKDSTTDAEDFQFNPFPMSSTVGVNDGPSATAPTVQQQQQRTTTITTTFPDDMHLQVPELALLRGCVSIAQRLQIQDLIWSLTSQSPFTFSTATTTTDGAVMPSSGSLDGIDSTAAILYGHLPPNLRPTQAQLSIPHHPAIDLLPWPSVRDRLIHVLAQPVEYRPVGAKSPTALVDFVYDIEDPAEGVRITGSDPHDPRNWEVGEKVFRGWWWCFDREIVTRTNQLRKARGVHSALGAGTMGSVVEDLG